MNKAEERRTIVESTTTSVAPSLTSMVSSRVYFPNYVALPQSDHDDVSGHATVK